MTEAIKEQKKSCPLCKKEYPERDNYCRRDGSRLEMTEAERGAPRPSGHDEGYAVEECYIPKPV